MTDHPSRRPRRARERDELGAKIRLARERKKLSQSDVAERVDVSVRTIRNWENGDVGWIRNRWGALVDALAPYLNPEDAPEPELPPDIERHLPDLTPEQVALLLRRLSRQVDDADPPAPPPRPKSR